MTKFYITTSIAYVNAPPHIGYALELIQADVLARHHRLVGNDTWFLTGTDEHGTKIAKASAAANLSPEEFTNQISEKFLSLAKVLNISNDDFIRTSDQKRHWPSAQKLWRELAERGDLYKKNYEGLYCIGHEAFMKKSDLKDGVCPLHKTKPEKIEEENWFFKLISYKKRLKKIIESDELQILPASRKSEVLNLLDDAEDISFSRPFNPPTGGIRWGVPVPDDATQTMYVWADALSNYISAIGYADDNSQALFKKFWPADIHLVGKDILRFHAIVWPAMLLSASLPLPKSIYVHGFITADGEKMSKTIGNVVDPFKMVEKYGSEVVRYYLLREIPSDEDGDFSEEKLKERYNGDLANGLGNLVQRVATLIENNLDGKLIYDEKLIEPGIAQKISDIVVRYKQNIESFRLHEALANVWELISFANVYIDDKKPWAAIKRDEKEFLMIMTDLMLMLHNIAFLLSPFLPETADKIAKIIGTALKPEIDGGYEFVVKKSKV
ncbi:MAG: methionine--tRNA ligase, partial [Candidatus Yanofskybacteria bacterium RIFCSPHIGHO2_01_FULL_44_22]